MNTGTQPAPSAEVLLPFAPQVSADSGASPVPAENSSPPGRLLLEYLTGCGAFFVITMGAFAFHTSFSSVAFVYLLMTVLAALRWGIREATVLSLAAFACLDFYFTPPVFSLRVTNSSDWTALVAFEIAGLIVSRLSARAQHHARVADRERRNAEQLYDLSRRILLLDTQSPAGQQISSFVRGAIGVEAVALFDVARCEVYCSGDRDPRLESLVRDSWIEGQEHSVPALREWSRLLRAGDKGIGAIALRARNLSPLVADAVASIAAVALARSRSLEKETRAEAARQSEHLRLAVLDALAHAFKTPLTVIRTVSSGLLEAGELGPRETELVSMIDDETAQLNELATRLLQTARLEGAAMPERHGHCDIVPVTRQVLAGFEKLREGRPLSFCPALPSAEVPAGAELVSTALSQLVDNAIKYSWPGTAVDISVTQGISETVVSVHNFGPPIAAADRERIFERFYRGSGTEHRAPGTGLGLSITKKVAESHQGRVWVISSEASGTTFFFALPIIKGNAI